MSFGPRRRARQGTSQGGRFWRSLGIQQGQFGEKSNISACRLPEMSGPLARVGLENSAEDGRKEHHAERTRCPGNAPGHRQPARGTSTMSTVMVPASAAEALGMLEPAIGDLADADAAEVP